MTPDKYWIWLSSVFSSGKKLNLILNSFASPEEAYFAGEKQYRMTGGFSNEDIAKLSSKDLTKAEKIISDADKKGVSVISYEDPLYPEQLRNIYDPPAVLYCRGNMPETKNKLLIGLVGTRKASLYGLNIARALGYRLSKAGILTVSGMAKGVDAAVSQGALEADAEMIAVLGCGPDVCYPAENRELYENIIYNGAVISEYPPGTEPAVYRFPARNRIISGISRGVVVVEAPDRSGALITAGDALEQGRDVFAVPGNIDAQGSAGCNRLISDGEAKPIFSVMDIVCEYIHEFTDLSLEEAEKSLWAPSVHSRGKSNGKKLTEAKTKPAKDEDAVISALKNGILRIDEIAEISGMPVQTILAKLTVYEIEGRTEQLSGNRYKLIF